MSFCSSLLRRLEPRNCTRRWFITAFANRCSCSGGQLVETLPSYSCFQLCDQCWLVLALVGGVWFARGLLNHAPRRLRWPDRSLAWCCFLSVSYVLGFSLVVKEQMKCFRSNSNIDLLFCVHNLLSFELFSLTISLALRDLLFIPLAQACSNDVLLSLSSLAALGNGCNRFRGLT